MEPSKLPAQSNRSHRKLPAQGTAVTAAEDCCQPRCWPNGKITNIAAEWHNLIKHYCKCLAAACPHSHLQLNKQPTQTVKWHSYSGTFHGCALPGLTCYSSMIHTPHYYCTNLSTGNMATTCTLTQYSMLFTKLELLGGRAAVWHTQACCTSYQNTEASVWHTKAYCRCPPAAYLQDQLEPSKLPTQEITAGAHQHHPTCGHLPRTAGNPTQMHLLQTPASATQKQHTAGACIWSAPHSKMPTQDTLVILPPNKMLQAVTETAAVDCCHSTTWPKLKLLRRRADTLYNLQGEATNTDISHAQTCHGCTPTGYLITCQTTCYYYFTYTYCYHHFCTGLEEHMATACTLHTILLAAQEATGTTHYCKPGCTIQELQVTETFATAPSNWSIGAAEWHNHTQPASAHPPMYLEITTNHPADASAIICYCCLCIPYCYYYYCYYCPYCTGPGEDMKITLHLPAFHSSFTTAGPTELLHQNYITFTQNAGRAYHHPPTPWLNADAELSGKNADTEDRLQPKPPADTSAQPVHHRTAELLLLHAALPGFHTNELPSYC